MEPDALANAVVLTVKAALAPVLERLGGMAAQLSALDGIRDRIVALETKSAMPLPTAPDIQPAVAELSKSLTAIEAALRMDMAALRERVAVAEVKPLLPGPAGAPGKDGVNGKDGANGLDGLGFEDLDVEFDGDRTLAMKFSRGTVRKTFPIVLPLLRYQGPNTDGRSYTVGDVVTYAGSTWSCIEATAAKPQQGVKTWTLCVKRGNDGRDGRDAPGALPVVSIGGGVRS